MASEPNPDEASNLQIPPFDETKLAEDEKEIHLFQWLSSTKRLLEDASLAITKASQSNLEKTLLRIIEVPESYPLPGRSLRKLVSRCLVLIYSRGETRTLFDTLQRLIKLVGDFKPTGPQDIIKTAAFFCIGELMLSFGSQIMSLMNDLVAVCLKICKSTSFVTILRYHAFMALGKSLKTARRALTDVMTKDIIKTIKSGITDKSLPVQRAASEAVISMYPSDFGIRVVAEVESYVNLCTRSLEGADQLTRRSLASVVGYILSSTQVETDQPEPDTSGRSRIPGEDRDSGVSSGTIVSEDRRSMLSPSEMLAQLSAQFNKPSATRKIRIGICDFYANLLINLGPTYVEKHYSIIVHHFLTDLVTNQRNSSTRYDILLVRQLICILLRDLIGVRLLSEQGQIAAIKELANSCLKRWPALMPGQTEPSHLVLSVVLKEVAGLLCQLGNAPPPVQDALADPLITLLSHPNHTTRVSAAWALQCFCFCTPLRLPKLILTVTEKLQRDINSISSPAAPSDIHLRALGHAYGLGALLSVIPDRPLYISYDISTRAFDVATQLLKRAGEHDVQIAAVEVEVAWTIIASLMTLGPNFVRTYLSQLLVLWRNALPKPTTKDASSSSGRSVPEWSFLLHVRESALGAILCFLRHNPALVSLDVSRRLSSLLGNALQFSNSFLSQTNEELLDQSAFSLSLRTREALLRRRIYQCFRYVGFSGIAEATQSSLLQSAMTLFASVDGYTGSSIQAAIASSSGTFNSVWQSGDGYAYGMTYIDIADDTDHTVENTTQLDKNNRNRDAIEISIDDLLSKPILGSCEHDPLALWEVRPSNDKKSWPEPPPAATSVVDAAIHLFAQLLPIQDANSAARAVSQLVESTKAVKPDRNAGRKAAVIINANIALCLAMRYATAHSRQGREAFGNSKVTSTLSPFLKDSLIDGDRILRNSSSEAIGRLCSLAGTTFMTSQMKLLVDEIVGNRDPSSRAGCALAFGAIYGYVGGLGAGPLLKTAVNMLMSLGNDPHPLVHFWALKSLARVIEAASLAYAPFVSGTLGMLFKIYTLDSHEPEGGSFAYANMNGDLPTYQAVCQVIDGVITVLGPDIQESSRTRNLVLDLVHEFFTEDDEGICVEAIKCIQHFLMFASQYADIPPLVSQFRVHMTSSRRPLKVASINALYQLVQRDAISMSKLGGDQLVEELFSMLDDDSSIDGVRNVITSWLQQTVIHNPSAWIDLCQRIMSRTTATQQATDAAAKTVVMRDDEGESLSTGLNQDSSTSHRIHLTSRWRTQLFALQCLHNICTVVGRSGRQEHMSIPFARSQGLPTTGLLVTRVPDLIKMAFTASAAYVTEIRLEGLTVLRDVISIFALSPDPLYEDALLLEQHQAPITAALTPAFSSETTPEILALAIEACAVFIGCGVIKDVTRMGRILKHLTSALEQCKGSGMLSMGDAGELSPNASVMLRIATLSAWAELVIASGHQVYLKDIIKPYRPILSSLWISSLRDYASIKVDSEVLQDESVVALDTSYSSLGKEVLLPYYHSSWPVILEAVATVMQEQDPYIVGAMQGIDKATDDTTRNAVNSEPTALFFVLFGLVYEALATASPDSENSGLARNLPVVALKCLKCLVAPIYSGNALFEPSTFDELMSLFYRMAITESAVVRVHLVDAIAVLAVRQDTKPDVVAPAKFSLGALPSDTPQVQCLRICAYVLRHAITTNSDNAPDRVMLINAAFRAYHTVATIFGDSIQELRAVGISLYGDLLKSEMSHIDFVGPTLPSLKMLLEQPTNDKDSADKCTKLVHGILSACLLNIDEMRGRQGLISARKVQNNLLAVVLILTVIPPSVRVSQVIVERCCSLICQKLVDPEVSLTAAHCAKTLILAFTSGNKIMRQCPRLLVAGMIEFIAKNASIEDGKISETQMTALGEVWKAISLLFSSTPEESRIHLLCVLLPAVSLVLDPLSATPSALHTQGVAQLLLYATSSPVMFKEATSLLAPPVRETLEVSIRQSVGNRGSAQGQQAAKPQISLRSF